MSLEAARLLHHIECEVQIYSPKGLPLKDDCPVSHPKVQELRSLMEWSDANLWCSPEQHGCVFRRRSSSLAYPFLLSSRIQITGVFKTIIDHIPLSIGSIRPTQGKALAVSQVR